MAVGQKHEAYIGIGIQTTLGTLVTRTIFTDIVSESIARDSTRAMSARLGSPSNRIHTETMRKSGGSIVVEGNFEGHESFYKAAFGASSVTTTGAGNPYTHTFALKKLMPDYGLSLEVNRDTTSFFYEGVKINTVEWAQDPEGYMQVTFGVMGRTETTGSATSPSFATTYPIIGSQAAFTIDGVAKTINNFRCTLDNQLAQRPQIGSLDIKEVIRGGVRQVTGSFEMDFEDVTTLTKFTTNANVALICTWTNSTRIFKLTLAAVHLIGANPPTNGPGPYTIPFNFVALEQTRAAMDELVLTITNSVSSVS